jgi:hypothetical protein
MLEGSCASARGMQQLRSTATAATTDRLIFLQQDAAGIWFYPPSGGTQADPARRAAFRPLPRWEFDAAGSDADAGNQADCEDAWRGRTKRSASLGRWTHPSLDHPSEPRPLAGDPGDAAKDGAPTFEGGSRFQKLCVGHPPLWCIVLMDGCASEICIEDSIWGGSYC